VGQFSLMSSFHDAVTSSIMTLSRITLSINHTRHCSSIRNDIKQNDTRHSDIKQNDNQHSDIKQNDTQHSAINHYDSKQNGTITLSINFK
jgi:hypothetical protein